MKKLMLLCFVMVLGLAGMVSAVVLSDDFEDGEFWYNPYWIINSSGDDYEVVQEPFLIPDFTDDNDYFRMAYGDSGQIYALFDDPITSGEFEVTMRIRPENTALSSDNYIQFYIGDWGSWTNTAWYNNSYYVQIMNRDDRGSEVQIRKWTSESTTRITLAQTSPYVFDGNWVDVKFTYDSSLASDNIKLYIGDMQTPYLTATDNGLTDFDNLVFTTRAEAYQWGIDDVTVVEDASKLAQNPDPANRTFVAPSLSELSWTNPQPQNAGNSIICDVYLSDANDFSTFDKVTLGSNVSTVSINTNNFPTFGNLADGKYYWRVDCKDTGTNVTTEGYKWEFYAVSGDNACAASHIITGAPYADGDINQDCKVDFSDFAIQVADWLSCTDTLTNCN